MKKTQWLCGIILSLALIVITLVTAFELAMYSDFSFYQRMYEKHQVLPELNMEMEDVMYVTREMMAYLRGNRETLSVYTMVDGEFQDFFGPRERFHMDKVQGLFLAGLNIRLIAAVVLLLSLFFLIYMKVDIKKLLPRAFQWTLAGFTLLTTIFGIAVAQNFSWVFDVFHEIFFEDECWLFDSRYSYMIRMLPEDFFFDMVVRIGIFLGVGLLFWLIISIILRCIFRRAYK